MLHNHRHFFGGAEVTYDPLLGAGYPIGPDNSTGAIPPPPYPPAVYYPAYYAPQPHCVRPKIIYLTDEKPVANLPRIIYGTPPLQCPMNNYFNMISGLFRFLFSRAGGCLPRRGRPRRRSRR